MKTNQRSSQVRWMSLLLCGAMTACASNKVVAQSTSACDGGNTPPDIKGKYVDNYGGTHDIGTKQWIMGAGPSAAAAPNVTEGNPERKSTSNASVFTYCSVNNGTGVLIAQNGAENPYFPNLYSQFNWTQQGGKLWYCQIAYNAQSAEAAAQVPPADPTNPATGGCSTFPWSELLPKN